MTWKKLMENDCCGWKFRKGVRSAMCAASQLPGAVPTKDDDDDDDDDDDFCDTVAGLEIS